MIVTSVRSNSTTSGRIDSVNVVISLARIRPDTRSTTRSPFAMRSIRSSFGCLFATAGAAIRALHAGTQA
jgi:hypothetical protein